MTDEQPYRSDADKKIAELEEKCELLEKKHDKAVAANMTWRESYGKMTEWEVTLSSVLGAVIVSTFVVFFSFWVLEQWYANGPSRAGVAVVLGLVWTLGGVFVGIGIGKGAMRRWKLSRFGKKEE